MTVTALTWHRLNTGRCLTWYQRREILVLDPYAAIVVKLLIYSPRGLIIKAQALMSERVII